MLIKCTNNKNPLLNFLEFDPINHTAVTNCQIKLTRRKTMSELRPFGGQLDSFQQLVDSFFGRNSLPALSDTRFNMPATDISENDNSYTISAELPGIKKEDVRSEERRVGKECRSRW